MPVVLYTYLNPVYYLRFRAIHGRRRWRLVWMGVLVLDLPPGRGRTATRNSNGPPEQPQDDPVDRPHDAAGAHRAHCGRMAEGFIYFVSREGVTGEQVKACPPRWANRRRPSVRRRCCRWPSASGFRLPAQAREAAQSVDAVVVGSAIVRKIGGIWQGRPI